jgi:hypothetical protein
MTESIPTKKLSGLPPGRCVYQRINQEKFACRKASDRAILAGIAAASAAAVPAIAIAAEPGSIASGAD